MRWVVDEVLDIQNMAQRIRKGEIKALLSGKELAALQGFELNFL